MTSGILVGPPNGITPMRAPYEGVQTNGMTVDFGSLTISNARSKSKRIGNSQKITSRSVIAKSWIIDAAPTSTPSALTSAPLASAT